LGICPVIGVCNYRQICSCQAGCVCAGSCLDKDGIIVCQGEIRDCRGARIRACQIKCKGVSPVATGKGVSAAIAYQKVIIAIPARDNFRTLGAQNKIIMACAGDSGDIRAKRFCVNLAIAITQTILCPA